MTCSATRLPNGRGWAPAALALLLALAPGAVPVVWADDQPATYRVRSGDNLIKIARRLGITLDELKRDNGLDSDLIRIGQKLGIGKPFHKFARQGDPTWHHPARGAGRRLLGYGRHENGRGVTIPHTGVDLAAAVGTDLRAPADGVVMYVGEQEGFGLLMILRHAGGYSSVLAPLDADAVAVRAGDLVLREDRLGSTGRPVEHETGYVHIELRRGGDAIDPQRLLR